MRFEEPDATGLLHGRLVYTPTAVIAVAFPDDPAIRGVRIGRADGPTLGGVRIDPADVRVSSASGPSAVTIRANGDPANRIDLVLVSEGYTAAEMGTFEQDAAAFAGSFFNEEPFREYGSYFNVHRLDVESAESGADHPEDLPPRYVETAFDATYNCANIERLICVDVPAVQDAVSQALAPDARDAIVVLVNDAEYGGSGGVIAVSSTNVLASEIVLHEFGHSFGHLADEYDTQPPICTPIEPAAANATIYPVRQLIKWRAWIDDATMVPTLTTQPGEPGAYFGADYCPFLKYRPTHASKMRILNRPFEQINSEQFVRRIYAFVSPIDASSPSGNAVVIGAGGTEAFSVVTTSPATHAIAVAWYLDGSLAGSSPTLVVTDAIGAGEHILELVVHDATTFVRNDPGDLLTARRSWTIDVA